MVCEHRQRIIHETLMPPARGFSVELFGHANLVLIFIAIAD